MNLVTYWALQQEGREFGLAQENWTKVAAVLDQAHDALGRAHAAGRNPAYGTDLLGVIAVGAAGDLVVTDEDPLADIGVLAESRLAAVVQDGQVVDGAAALG